MTNYKEVLYFLELAKTRQLDASEVKFASERLEVLHDGYKKYSNLYLTELAKGK
jgi:hypothetical protein